MLVGQRKKKSQKYFDLLTFNYNLYDSNPCSSLGVMNFQKWELFSGSPSRYKYKSLERSNQAEVNCAIYKLIKETCEKLQHSRISFKKCH